MHRKHKPPTARAVGRLGAAGPHPETGDGDGTRQITLPKERRAALHRGRSFPHTEPRVFDFLAGLLSVPLASSLSSGKFLYAPSVPAAALEPTSPIIQAVEIRDTYSPGRLGRGFAERDDPVELSQYRRAYRQCHQTTCLKKPGSRTLKAASTRLAIVRGRVRKEQPGCRSSSDFYILVSEDMSFRLNGRRVCFRLRLMERASNVYHVTPSLVSRHESGRASVPNLLLLIQDEGSVANYYCFKHKSPQWEVIPFPLHIL